GERFEGPGGLPSVPVTMDLTQMSDEYRAFTDRQDVGLWMEDFERVLFAPGDALVTAGELADRAFLIVEGLVEVRTGELVASTPAVHLRRGHTFGELSLLSPRVRPYTMVALEPTDAMVLRRDDFQAQLQTRPELAMGLIRSVGTRFEDGLQAPANRLPRPAANPTPRVKSS
ncbi:MAG: cyclic nucleotide-binding domain-containing protein, partial [Myxococcota bacterium]